MSRLLPNSPSTPTTNGTPPPKPCSRALPSTKTRQQDLRGHHHPADLPPRGHRGPGTPQALPRLRIARPRQPAPTVSSKPVGKSRRNSRPTRPPNSTASSMKASTAAKANSTSSSAAARTIAAPAASARHRRRRENRSRRRRRRRHLHLVAGGPSVRALAAMVIAAAGEMGVSPTNCAVDLKTTRSADLVSKGISRQPLALRFDHMAALTDYAAKNAPRPAHHQRLRRRLSQRRCHRHPGTRLCHRHPRHLHRGNESPRALARNRAAPHPHPPRGRLGLFHGDRQDPRRTLALEQGGRRLRRRKRARPHPRQHLEVEQDHLRRPHQHAARHRRSLRRRRRRRR
jgi:hypothetical protein